MPTSKIASLKQKVESEVRAYLEEDVAKGGKVALIGGGIGDFIALDSFLTERERKSFDTVYQVGYRPPMYRSFFLSYFNVKQYRYFWDCLGSKEKTWALQRHLIRIVKQYPATQSFVNFDFRNRIYRGSTFTENTLADVSAFYLPNEYVVICPYTVNATEKWASRRLSDFAWKAILQFLESLQKHGIVLGVDCQSLEHPYVTNLSDRTSIFEAIEITKSGSYYIGIDSMLSMIASVVMPSTKTLVQSKRGVGIAWMMRDIYYPLGVQLVEEITPRSIKKLMRDRVTIL